MNKINRYASIATLSAVAMSSVHAQTTANDLAVYEAESDALDVAAALQERLADAQAESQAFQRLTAAASLFLAMDSLVSNSVPDSAGAPDYVTLFGDTASTRLEPGARGKALKFATSNYATVSNSSDVDVGTEDFSLFTWVRTTTATEALLDKRQASGSRGYSLNLAGGELLFQMATSTGWDNYYHDSSPLVNDGNWHHVGVTIDRDNATGGKLYVDGKVVHTFNPTRHVASLSNTSALYIGRHPFNGGTLNGALDEVFLTKKALSESEVTDLMATSNSPVSRTTTYTANLSIPSRTSTTITVSYSLPDPQVSKLMDYRLCESTFVVYENDPCSDPRHKVHHLSYDSTKSVVQQVYRGYEPDTTYYFGITAQKTDPKTGVTSVVKLGEASTKTLNSTYRDRVWHSDVTETSVKINWTSAEATSTGYVVCWKNAGEAIGVCSDKNYDRKRGVSSTLQEGSYTIAGLIPSTRYKYKVLVADSAVDLDKVGRAKFTTNPAPRIDVWSQNVTKSSMEIWWTANSIYSSYQVCWKRVTNLRSVCYENHPYVYSPTTKKLIDGLSAGKKYKIKVTGITSSGVEKTLFEDVRKTAD